MLFASEDQRLFQRMKLDTKIILATAQTRVEGVCRNISATGVLMEVTAGHCQVGEEWQLVVPSADNHVEPLKAIATILRVESGAATDMVGISLSEVR